MTKRRAAPARKKAVPKKKAAKKKASKKVRKKAAKKKVPARKSASKPAPRAKRVSRETADVVQIHRHTELSISQLSMDTGFTRETVSKRLADAGTQPSRKHRGYPVYRLLDVLPALYQSHDGEFDPDKLKPFERHAYYKAEREKLHLQIERRDVVPLLEVERLYGTRNKQVVQKVTTLMDVLERDCGLTPSQAARVERHMDELMDALYKLSADDDADSADRDSA